MKIFLPLLAFISLAFYCNAQVIMVCNPSGTSCMPYLTLDDAYSASNSGDYIYLPGGLFTISNIIDKEIHLIGSGYNQDSANVTNYTLINSPIILNSNSNNSSFEGIYLSGNFLSYNSDTIKNILIKRVNLGACYSRFKHCYFQECVFRESFGQANFYLQELFINNCIFNGQLNFIQYSQLRNCFFIYSNYNPIFNAGGTLVSCEYSTVINSIFLNLASSTTNLTAINNLFLSASGNVAQDINNSFSTCTQNFANCPSSYTNSVNYQLLPNAPGKNAGDDGTDVGIYGGLFPWNEGGVPSNPHIYYKNIPSSTNSSNNLPVNIKVRVGN